MIVYVRYHKKSDNIKKDKRTLGFYHIENFEKLNAFLEKNSEKFNCGIDGKIIDREHNKIYRFYFLPKTRRVIYKLIE